jgi:hypothetical protein
MAKASVITAIGGILKFVIIVIVGVFVFLFLRDKFLQTKQEQQDTKDFKKKGLFKAFGDFLLGENDANAEKTKDTNLADKEEQAKQEVSDLESKIAQRDAQAEAEIDKTIGSENLSPRVRQKLIDEKKKEIENRDASNKSIFDRSSNDIKIFRFEKPINTGKGKIIDFAVFDKSSKTAQEAQIRKEEAKREAEEAGFNVTKGSTPINTLTSSDERIQRFKQQLEASQKRRLGVRDVPITKDRSDIVNIKLGERPVNIRSSREQDRAREKALADKRWASSKQNPANQRKR